MSEERQRTAWGLAVLAGLPHLLFPLVGESALIGHYLSLTWLDENAALTAFLALIAGVLVVAWRRGWPRWAASWIGYGVIVAQLVPYGDTFINRLSSQMPTGLDNLFFFARVILSFGVGFLLVGRDRLSGLLVAPPALMLWLWLQSDAIRSVIALPLLIGAGIAAALGATFTLRTGEKRVGIRLALLIALVTRLPFTYAGLYHHDFAPPPTALQALVAVLRDLLIAAALVAGPLWGWALWVRIRRLIAHGLGAQGYEDKKRVDPQSFLSTVWETLRRWWFIGAIPVVAVALITGAHPGDWLDVALDASGCLGVIEQHDSPVQSVAFSPAGDLLASGSKDGTARIWRIDDGRKSDRTLLQRLKIPTGGREVGYSHDVAFSPDGETLAFGLPDGTVRLWRVEDGTLLHTLRGHTNKVCSLAFSPEEAILVPPAPGTARYGCGGRPMAQPCER